MMDVRPTNNEESPTLENPVSESRSSLPDGDGDSICSCEDDSESLCTLSNTGSCKAKVYLGNWDH